MDGTIILYGALDSAIPAVSPLAAIYRYSDLSQISVWRGRVNTDVHNVMDITCTVNAITAARITKRLRNVTFSDSTLSDKYNNLYQHTCCRNGGRDDQKARSCAIIYERAVCRYSCQLQTWTLFVAYAYALQKYTETLHFQMVHQVIIIITCILWHNAVKTTAQHKKCLQ